LFFFGGKKLVKHKNQNQTKRKLLKSTTLPNSGKLQTSNEMCLLVGCNILIQRHLGGTNRFLSDFFGIPTTPIHQQQNHVTLIGPRKSYPSRTRQKGHRCGSDPLRTPEFWGSSPWLLGGFGANNDMDVSRNSGTPKSSILIGFSIINHPFWGTPNLGNTHMFHSSFVKQIILVIQDLL